MRMLRVLFVHAKGDSIHLWTLKIPSKDVQVLELVGSSQIPLLRTETAKMMKLGNLLWKKMKEYLPDSCDIINKMKQQHNDYEVLKQIDPNTRSRTNLSSFVEREIQKPVRGSKFSISDLLQNTSLTRDRKISLDC
ncbi:unnamed protein product [Mucor hiemalis]